MTRTIIDTGNGEVELVAASFTAPDVISGGTVLASVGPWAGPSTWQTPETVTFSTDGKTVTVAVRIGPGHTNPPAGTNYWLYVKVTSGTDVYVERIGSRFVTTDASANPLAPAGPGVIASPTAPDPMSTLIWFDTSTVPPVGKYWDGSAWTALPTGSSASPDLIYGAGVYGSGVYSPSA